MVNEDYYAVLGVDRRANAAEIKRAYRRLTLEYHPDRYPGDPVAEERYRRINQAYATLGDADDRARYDASMLRLDAIEFGRGLTSHSARDLIGNMIGDLFGARRRERRRGRDLRYTLTVDFEQAVLGTRTTIEFEAPGECQTCAGTGTRPRGRQPEACPLCSGKGELKGDGFLAGWTRCGRCDGTGLVQRDACQVCRGRGTKRALRVFEVAIAPGTESGAVRVCAGQGEPGRFGGQPGDLRVTVNVRSHEWFRRREHNVLCEIPVSITEAALGGTVLVPTVDGVVSMELPAGTKSGTQMRLRRKGVPHRGGRGDQIVTIVVETPTVDPEKNVLRLLQALEDATVESGALPRRARMRDDLGRRGTGGAETGDDDPG